VLSYFFANLKEKISNTMGYVLGIDGGGTTTTCILMNDARQVLSRSEAGPSNYQSIGLDAAGNAIELAIAQCLSLPSLPSQISIKGFCLGLAGVGRSKDVKIMQNWVQKFYDRASQSVSVKWDFKPENIKIYSDSTIALVGGIGSEIGIVAIAGTGSQIFGQNKEGKTKRVGGWGYLLGDEGSGYNIAIGGLQAVLKSYDGRLEETKLTDAFKTHLNLSEIEGLISVVYRQGWSVKDIAALAPIVAETAQGGDRVAQRIIQEAIDQLIWATRVAINDLFLPDESLEIVLVGGVWQIVNFRASYQKAISAIVPSAHVILPRNEPAYGAALLALGNF
jgi:N-acetylglucosamine kinase-like BadF-type ATPase